jgi:hypothetical protein
MLTLKGEAIVPEFLQILEDYVASRYDAHSVAPRAG